MALIFESFVQDKSQQVCPIKIEVEILRGMPDFQIVGLGSKALNETKERTRATLKNLGYQFPIQRKIINLSPAHLPKTGTHTDLPIALGLLLRSQQEKLIIPQNSLFLGELDLNGNLTEAPNLLPIVIAAKEKGIKNIFLPASNLEEASLVEGVNLYPLNSFKDLIRTLKKSLPPSKIKHSKQQSLPEFSYPTFDDLINQQISKRLLTIALAGYHKLLLVGPPGHGKSVLAESSKNLLPPLSSDQFKELLSQNLTEKDNQFPSFQKLDSGVSKAELLGSKTNPKGIISKCQYGALVINEFPELKRPILESLKAPLENIAVSLIATMNPCRCGYFGDAHKACFCTEYDLLQYRAKLSGALLERFDLHYTVITEPLVDKPSAKQGQTLKAYLLVSKVRHIQYINKRINSNLSLKDLLNEKQISPKAKQLIALSEKRYHLPTRRVLKLLQVAQTIADLEGANQIKEKHLAESISYQTRFFPDYNLSHN